MEEKKPLYVNWIPDSNAESVLKKGKHKWRIGTFPTLEIDLETSMQNRGRMKHKRDGDRVQDYGCRMIDHVEFTRPVLNVLPKCRPFILGGIHRISGAIEAEVVEVEAYVVQITDSLELDILPILLNDQHGVNVDEDEKLNVARFAMQEHNLEAKSLAKRMALNYDKFLNFNKKEDCKVRLLKWSVDGSKLAQQTLLSIASIKNDNLFSALGRLYSTYKPNADRACAIADQVKQATTELAARDIIQKAEDRFREDQRPDRQLEIRLKTRAHIFRHQTALINLLQKCKNKKATQLIDEKDWETFCARQNTINREAHRIGGYTPEIEPSDQPHQEADDRNGARRAGGRRSTHVR